MFDFQAQRDMNNGFGDGFTRAFELAVTPLVFGFFGYLVDRWLDTSPIFTVGLAVFALVAMVLRFWYGYDHEMKTHEAGASWRRNAAAETPLSETELWGDDTEVAS